MIFSKFSISYFFFRPRFFFSDNNTFSSGSGSSDTFLISKYRSDYESAILNLDDLISNLMLNTALTVDQSNPITSIEKLGKMQQAKTALNTVMKFLDNSS